MAYIGWLNEGKVVEVTDGNGCYDENGKCYCAECYYYGADRVNCANAGVTKNSVPVRWNGESWEVITQ